MKYLTDLIYKKDGVKIYPISSHYKDPNNNPKFPSNITITHFQGQQIINTRLTDYCYIPVPSSEICQYVTICQDHHKISSINTIQKLNENQSNITYQLIGNESVVLGNGISYCGLEDVRLIVWNDILYGIGFRPDIIEGKVIAQLIEYNDDLSINKSWFINTDKEMEKNWQPVEAKPFTFMYDPSTSSIITLDIENLQVADNNEKPTIINYIETPEYNGNLSGSSQLMRVDDGWISICHQSRRWFGADGLIRWVYDHYFVGYNEDLSIKFISKPFRFVGDCMEFCCGLCKDDETNTSYISFSILDGSTHVIEMNLDILINIIERFVDETTPDMKPTYDYIYDTYNTDKLISTDRLSVAFLLESLQILPNVEKIPDIINCLGPMDPTIPYYKTAMLLHFIIRRPDNEPVLNYFKRHKWLH